MKAPAASQDQSASGIIMARVGNAEVAWRCSSPGTRRPVCPTATTSPHAGSLREAARKLDVAASQAARKAKSRS
jgi:hypothetical protein